MSSIDLFEEIIKDRSENIREIARAVRAKFYMVYPEVDETVWEKQKTAGYGIGPKKMSEHFGWIMTAKSHVNMGFNYGASLPDPERLLEGTGKNMRHIKIRDINDLEKPGIAELINRAVEERKTHNTYI